MIEKINIIDAVEKLNIKFYELFSKLDRYSEKLGDQMYNFMAQKLYEVYKEEFERGYADYAIQRECEKFQEQERFATLVPRRWKRFHLFRRQNQAADLIQTEVLLETREFFRQIESKIFNGTPAEPTTEPTPQETPEEPTAEPTPQETPEEPATEPTPQETPEEPATKEATEIPEKQGHDDGDQKDASKNQSPKTGQQKPKQE